VDGEATILADTSRVQALEAQKYGLMYRVVRLITSTARTVRRQPEPESVTISIAPLPKASEEDHDELG
jgi:hypothetical protein